MIRMWMYAMASALRKLRLFQNSLSWILFYYYLFAFFFMKENQMIILMVYGDRKYNNFENNFLINLHKLLINSTSIYNFLIFISF